MTIYLLILIHFGLVQRIDGLPQAVTNLTVVSVTTFSASLTWNNVSGHTYEVFTIDKTIQDATAQIAGITTTNSFTVSGLLPGHMYEFIVRSVLNGEKSSNTTIGATLFPGRVIINPSTSSTTNSSATLQWTAGANSQQDFYIVRYRDNDFRADGDEKYLPSDQTFYTFENLNAGHKYTLFVKAYKSGHFGEESAIDLFTMPPTPSSVLRYAATTTSLTVIWTRPSSGKFSSYIIHINDTNNTSMKISHGDQEVRELTFNSPALLPGTQYRISLKTELTTGSTVLHSEPASITYYTKPEEAINILVQAPTNSSLRVSWDVPLHGGFTEFQVSLKEVAGSVKDIKIGMAREAMFEALLAGKQYTVEIITFAGDQSKESASVLATTRPNKPTDLIVQQRRTTNITVTWNVPVDGGKEHFLLLIQSDGESEKEITVSSAVTSFTATSLQPGKMYTFQVFTVYKTVRSDGTSLSTKTAPNPIRNLRTTSKTTREVTLQWDAPEQQASVGYHIRITVVGTGNLHSEDTLKNTMKIYFLTPGEKYDVEVKSYVLDNGEQRFSSIRSLQFSMVPRAPENFRTKNLGVAYLEVEWNNPSDLFTGFEISYKRTDTGVSFGNQIISMEKNYYQIDNLEPGIEYVITITTLSGVERSSARSITQRTAPGGTQVKREGVTENSITVSWTRPEQGFVSGYQLQINPNDGNEDLPIDVNDISTLQYTFDDLLPGRPYSILVTVKAGDTSSSHATRSITTLPMPVNNLIGRVDGTDKITLIWWIDPTSTQQQFVIEYGIEGGNPTTTNVGGDYVTREITNLKPGATYYINIYAKTSDGVSSERRQINVTTEPLPVGLFTGTVESGSSVTLRWKPDDNSVQDSYLIDYQSIYKQTSWKQIAKQSGESVTVDELHPGDSYSFRILAKSEDMISLYKYFSPATMYPLSPKVINLTARTSSTLSIEWPYDESLSHVDYWKISKTPSGKTLWEDEPLQVRVTTSYELRGLTPGFNYTIRIHAKSAGVSSIQSTLIEATVAPRITTNLIEKTLWTTTSTAILTYTEELAGNGVFDHYKFSIQNSDIAVIKQSRDVDRIVKFVNLFAGTLYKIEAVTVSGKVSSDDIQFLDIYTKPYPPAVRCKDKEINQISLEMEKPSGGVDRYEIECNGDSCPSEPRYAAVYQKLTSEMFSNLKPYTEYIFKVKSHVKTKTSLAVEITCKTKQNGSNILSTSSNPTSTLPAATACPTGWFGVECDWRCHCADGAACHGVSGRCEAGCRDGWTGHSCDVNQDTNQRTVILSISIVAGILFITTLIALVALVFAICRRQKVETENVKENTENKINFPEVSPDAETQYDNINSADIDRSEKVYDTIMYSEYEKVD